MLLWMIAVVLGYFVKGVTGFANTLVVSSVMSFSTVNASISPVELLLSVPTNVYMAWRNRREIDWRLCLPPLVMVLAGDIVGVWLLRQVDASAVKAVFGAAIILIGAEMLLRERRGVQHAGKAVLVLLGTAAGVLSGLFGVGALLAAYFTRVTRTSGSFKGSMCFVFAAENLFRVAAYSLAGILTGAVVRSALLLVPCMGLGLWLGMRLCGRMDEQRVRHAVIVMLMLSGAALLLTNL